MENLSRITVSEVKGERSQPRPLILIVDDDELIRHLVQEVLCGDHECVVASSFPEALAVLEAVSVDLVLSDIKLGLHSGLDLVPHILDLSAETVVIMMSGLQGIAYAIEAMRVGAFDYVTKPLDVRVLQAAVRRALSHHRLLEEKRLYEDHLEELVQQRTAEIEHLAYHDRLTNLPNRFLFSDRCAQAIAIAQREKHVAAVLLVSLDRLSKVTDTLGHSAGDMILCEAAARLRSCVGDGDTVARFDGAEFALLFPHLIRTSDATEISMAICDAFAPPFRLAERELYMTTSVGIGLYPSNGENCVTILNNAAAALDRARKNPGCSYQFYAADMNALALKRLALETGLRRAVENKETVVHYQPIVSLASGEVVEVEALVRWMHPSLGLLAPQEFIQLAEETGVILEIGGFVLQTACAQLRSWQDSGFSSLRMAVNVSAREFEQPGFVGKVAETLSQNGLDPASLELELTETSIMKHGIPGSSLLKEIRKLGVRIAIDDFGTGYSSLSYLKRLPKDTVKLDRSFVAGATSDPDDAALVMAMITLAHNLKLKVIAEGVETEEQLAFLRLLRCEEAQGFLFSKPVPADQIASLITRLSEEKRGQADLQLALIG